MIGSVTEAQQALKMATDAHGQPGPGQPMMPGHAEAEQFARPYIGEGHAAESPMAEPPRMSPVRHDAPGLVQELAMPGAPPPMASVVLPANAAVMLVPQVVQSSYCGGSPSER